MTTAWVQDLNKKINNRKILSKWWAEGRRFQGINDGVYPSIHLRVPYIYAVAMVSRIYGEPDAMHVKEAWVPLIYTIVEEGLVFNWAAILSHTLRQAIIIVKEHNPDPPSHLLHGFLPTGYHLC
jgi:hypothetical protein